MKAPRLLLGVSGSIAAYKIPSLVRLLHKQGWQVKIVLSQSASQFVSVLSLSALNEMEVYGVPTKYSLDNSPMLHIDLAKWADLILIAPASANVLARLSAGLADDLLMCVLLASQAPVFLAPSMNENMWAHPAVQANKETLEARGAVFLGPEQGEQACGAVGLGRMREPEQLLEDLQSWRQEAGLLRGLKILISAGGTQEAIDPVRFIANRSSGKMGYALASTAQQMGAQVTLISAPSALSCPAKVNLLKVRSAQEMCELVLRLAPDYDMYLSAAAIGDWKVLDYSSQKIKRTEKTLTLKLIANEDLLLTLSQQEKPPFIIGFCAETQDLQVNAQAKRRAKGVPVMIANLVGEGELGFESDENEVLFLSETGEEWIERQSKLTLARLLWKKIKDCYERDSSKAFKGS